MANLLLIVMTWWAAAAEPELVSLELPLATQLELRLPEPLVRRVDRRQARTQSAESRWLSALSAVRALPTDPARARQLHRREQALVNKRARLVRVQRKLDAVGAPARWVDVFFATSREKWTRGPDRFFSARDAGRLHYGIATVKIPEEHRSGAVEGALQVVAVRELEVEAWEAALGDATESAGVFTYIHGFNNSFTYAARRTAQISHDLGTPVVPVLFSWAASGGTPFSSTRYVVDENVAARSSLLLAGFLDRLLAVRSNTPVSVLAHSLGSRLFAEALLDLDRAGGVPRNIEQVVFAAPDIDAWLFANRYLGLVTEASNRFTLYCARDDRAVRLSRGVHGGYDRLGGCRDDALAGLQREGVDVVDASKLYVDLLDHNKVTSSPRLLRDLRLVLDGVAALDPVRQLVDRGDRAELPP